MTAATADNAIPSKETRTSMYHFLVLLDPICVTPPFRGGGGLPPPLVQSNLLPIPVTFVFRLGVGCV